MIVQTAQAGQPHFIITQMDHAEVSGMFATHFGNASFAPLDPAEPLVYVATHHDDGWADVDGDPQLDKRTNLPYHLTQTPTRKLVETSNKSPDANEKHHPLSGILSSMHTYGLYHGRYGLSDKIYIDMIDDSFRDGVEKMLDNELTRQERLKQELRESGHADLAAEPVLFHNYKLLQFFDTLALYIQTVHREAVGDSEFVHVPLAVDNDTTIIAMHPEPGTITLDPWPFDVDSFTIATKGRYVLPFEEGAAPADLGAYLFTLPMVEQSYIFSKA